jgi:glucose/mannose-6-phosphate isomerase
MSDEGLGTMREWALDLPGQIREAMARARAVNWPASLAGMKGEAGIDSVFLGGMGGSSMACQLARSILADRLAVPCEVHQDPDIPRWVGPNTLAGVVSYSGETWEALHLRDACLARGALVFAVARGGSLLSCPRLSAEACFTVPVGFAPRAAVGWMLIPILLALAGEAKDLVEADLYEALDLMEEEAALWRDGAACPGRDPRVLARTLARRMVYVYTSEERYRPLGIRWKNQILENGKQVAAESAFPELAHNDIMGWSFAVQKQAPVFLLLETTSMRGGIRGRMVEAALAELAETGGTVVRVPERGKSVTASLLTHLALADLTSVELAAELGLDPLPVEAIERVKQTGAKGGGA